MSEIVLLEFCGEPLALTREQLAEARARGRELIGKSNGAAAQVEASASVLLTAEQLAERSGVPASWWMTQARERRVPFRKIGRYTRFDPTEALGCEAFLRKAIPVNGAGCGNQ